MVEEKKSIRKHMREMTFKALKAFIKAALFYGLYFVFSMFLTPISDAVPGFQKTIESFVMIYILMVVVGELTSGTIFQHFFNSAKALFVMLYLIFALRGGIVGMALQDVNLIVDLRWFLTIAILLSLLGLAKSIVQAVQFLNERAEPSFLQSSMGHS